MVASALEVAPCRSPTVYAFSPAQQGRRMSPAYVAHSDGWRWALAESGELAQCPCGLGEAEDHPHLSAEQNRKVTGSMISKIVDFHARERKE